MQTYFFEPFLHSQNAEQRKITQQKKLFSSLSSRFFPTQNPVISQDYQFVAMKNKVPSLFYLQKYEISKKELKLFCQTSNTVESIQNKINSYLWCGSSVILGKSLMIFTGTDAEENAAIANLKTNIGPELIKNPVHHNWIHRCTALLQTALNEAAQKCCSVQFYQKKMIGKLLNKIFQRKKRHHRRILCSETCRLLNVKLK